MRKKAIITMVGLSTLLMSGCSSTKTTEINVLATADLHGSIPYELSEYAKEELKKDENVALVDAGDFLDGDMGGEMAKYFDLKCKDFYNNKQIYREVPLAKDMKDVGYDAVVLGNHEFVSCDKFDLDNMISDFDKQGIDVLSANLYNENGDSYVKPYIIKKVSTPEGEVNLGILGLTIKEIGEKWDFDENGNKIKAKSRELKDNPGYKGKLYMNELVEDAKKWVKVMKKDNADVIVAVVHSGEKPKNPKNPGNRIQELAKEVDGIDAIVAGHTHKEITQHDYENDSGENVIVTQPGAHGDFVSKINFELTKNKDGWKVINKSSNLKRIEQAPHFENTNKLYNKMYSLDENIKETVLEQVAPFKWGKAYVFKGPITKEEIYNKVGYKWASITDIEDENILQVVFIEKRKVVSYFSADTEEWKIDESDFKDNISTIYPNKNDKFKIERKEEENGMFSMSFTNIKN